ncbi:hypothetical protein Q8W71_31490 [Methylobacterium sp. NEAU 140]|uniref:hypothetical protein n=1 Tax=Methylobacterium sp. NEAU 140 TaxID=3064945 RepID=UPI002735D083|nr:hypothetical protein [Methylobacterium sp. NEAU 140]MDP4027110.1 hypothetical protein [Methylobacterium sp. NEAU 140]
MRAVQLFTAGFLLASALFVTTMLVAPPISEAAVASGETAPASTPLELVGP